MALVIGSAGVGDEAFLAAFESCEWPLDRFRHGDHLRLAWIQLHAHTRDRALDVVREGIQRYAAHHGVSHIFHETVTEAWVRLLATHDEATFAEFIARNEYRLTIELLHRFWTPEVLGSEAARRGWVAPDRAALPE